MSAEIKDQINRDLFKLDDDPLDPDINGRIGMLFDAYSRDEEAEVFYGRARFLDPSSFRWHYLHGRKLAKQGKTKAAIIALEQALERRRGHPGAQLILAAQYYAEPNIEKSTELFTQLIERNPEFARAYYEYGRLLFEQGNTDAAIHNLTTALRFSNRYGKAHYLLSQVYRNIGDQDRARLHLSLFERYRLFQPGQNDSLLDKIAALNLSDSYRLERALLASAAGNKTKAAKLLEELAATGSVSAHINLIATYGDMQQYHKAQEHADTALSMTPDSLELLDNIGVLRIKQGRYKEAAESFRMAIDFDPEYSVPYKNLGAVLESLGDLPGAMTNYQRALDLDPYDRQARLFLAKMLLQVNKPAEAITVIEVIVPFSQPETPQYWWIMGRAYERIGDFAKAVDAYQQAVIAAQVRGQRDTVTQAGAALKRARGMLQP